MRFQPNIRCPECGGSDVARSQRANRLERLFSRYARLWPLRCVDCNHRWFVFSLYDPRKVLNPKLKRRH